MSNKIILMLCGAFIIFGIGVWVLIFTFGSNLHLDRSSVEAASQSTVNEQPSPPLNKPSPAPSVVSREDAKGMVSFDYKWGKAGLGMVMEVDFTFTNRSPYPAKDITVTCTHYAPSGTEIDSNTRTIYEIIPAKGKKTIRNFNMGFIHSQASSSSCKIDDLEM